MDGLLVLAMAIASPSTGEQLPESYPPDLTSSLARICPGLKFPHGCVESQIRDYKDAQKLLQDGYLGEYYKEVFQHQMVKFTRDGITDWNMVMSNWRGSAMQTESTTRS